MRKILSVFLKVVVAIIVFCAAFLPVIHWVATLVSPKVAELRLLPLDLYRWGGQPLRWYDQLPQVIFHECLCLVCLIMLGVVGAWAVLVVKAIWKKL